MLKVIAEGVDTARRRERRVSNKLEFISFQKSGEKGTAAAKREHGILSTVADWEMVADIGRRMSFPQQVAVTQS